ncbi:MAG: class I SAM-dependent methyltransferase [Candidatus Omnitrophica bacterium]|nr:class I SAM-dependent methyltransferase [Candidatus Omnitrophota bacterium]
MNNTNPEVWTRIWNRAFSREANKLDIEREGRTVRWKKIRREISRRLGSCAGLKVIEIGAGRGTCSLLMSLQGAHATLLDNNPWALERAKEFFAQWNCAFTPVLQDAFSPPPELAGQFDVAMSYGFTEHFRYPERFKIYESHLELLRPGGLLIVSVPNAAFIPYRIGKFMLEKMNRWMLGLEIPYFRGELADISRKLDLYDAKVIGSGVIGDTLNFWLTQRLLHAPRYFLDRITRHSKMPLKERFHYFSWDPATGLDDFFGYALVLIGQKKKT